jgi:hypothetical protein
MRACDSCRALKARCDGGSPCRECSRRQIACSLAGTSPTLASSSSREEKEKRAIAMYWSVFHPRWPFVHQASFQNYEEGPLLVQSIIAIGLWATGEQSARSAALQLHKVLGSALLDQRVCSNRTLSTMRYVLTPTTGQMGMPTSRSGLRVLPVANSYLSSYCTLHPLCTHLQRHRHDRLRPEAKSARP